MSSTFPPRLSGASAAVPAGLTLSPQAPRSHSCCHQPQTGRWGGLWGSSPRCHHLHWCARSVWGPPPTWLWPRFREGTK